MTAQIARLPLAAHRPPPEIIGERLVAMSIGESKTQTAYAIIGALEQAGWVIVRKRHQR